jgi:serine/threonine protein kinase
MGYRKLRELGRGGVATVWLAVDDEGREVALKQLDILRDDLRDRLIYEGRVQRAVQHGNVVRVHDALELDGRPTLVLEVINGGTLTTWAPGRDYAEIEAVLRGILAGLGAAHEAGLVHRDLKPGNILMDGDNPKIADFGVARALDGDASGTRTGMALGTPWYMPPEQIRDPRHVDRRADLWAVGAILYELLAGRPPLVGDDVVSLHDQAVRRAWLPIRQLRPDVPANLVAAIDATLRPSRDDRVASVTALLLLLDGAGGADDTADTAGRWRLGRAIPEHPPVRSWEVTADGVAGVAKAIPVGADKSALIRFEREEQLLRELTHPRIPKVVDGFVEGGRRWFVREAVPGVPLSAENAAHRPTLAEILDRLDQILRTVADLHALVPPVVHRDLTPDAIVIRPEGAWIVEFGTAKGDTDGRVADGTFVGTFGFMAPEQFGGEAGVASDIRAVGAIAAWMLTRRHPRALERNGELAWRAHTQVSPALAAWVDNLLDPDPSRRPTADAARVHLELLRERAAPNRQIPPPKPFPLPPAPVVITAAPGEPVNLEFPEVPALRPKQQWLRVREYAPSTAAVAGTMFGFGLVLVTLSLFGTAIIGLLLFTGNGASAYTGPTIGAIPGLPEPPSQILVPQGIAASDAGGDIEPTADEPAYANMARLQAPWTDLSLPPYTRVLFQSAHRLVVETPGDAAAVSDQYTDRIVRAGWHFSGNTLATGGDVVARSRDYRNESRKLHLRIDSDGRQSRVNLTLLDATSGGWWDDIGLPTPMDSALSQTASEIHLERVGDLQTALDAYDAGLRDAGWSVDRTHQTRKVAGAREMVNGVHYSRKGDSIVLSGSVDGPWPSPVRIDITRSAATLPDLAPPWDTLGLPDEYDDVSRKVPDVITAQEPNQIRFSSADTMQSAWSRYDAALTRAGWRPDGDRTTSAVRRSGAYLRDGRHLALAVAPDLAGSRISVSLGDIERSSHAHITSDLLERRLVAGVEPVAPIGGEIPLEAPWRDLGLPGRVLSQTDTSLHLMVAGDPETVTSAYRNLLLADGFVAEAPVWAALGVADWMKADWPGHHLVVTIGPEVSGGQMLVTLRIP